MRSRKCQKKSSQILLKSSVIFFALLIALPALAKPWPEHQAHLGALKKQIESSEEEIKHLIEHKNHATDPREVQHAVKEIADKHKALEKITREYSEEREHVRFSHPDKNVTVEREYRRHNFKTLIELENEIGVDGQLDKIKAHVLQIYPLPERPKAEREAEEKRKPAAVEEDIDQPEKIKLVK